MRNKSPSPNLRGHGRPLQPSSPLLVFGRYLNGHKGKLKAQIRVFFDIKESYFEVARLTFRLAAVFLAGVGVLPAGLALALPLPIASRIA